MSLQHHLSSCHLPKHRSSCQWQPARFGKLPGAGWPLENQDFFTRWCIIFLLKNPGFSHLWFPSWVEKYMDTVGSKNPESDHLTPMGNNGDRMGIEWDTSTKPSLFFAESPSPSWWFKKKKKCIAWWTVDVLGQRNLDELHVQELWAYSTYIYTPSGYLT